MVSSFFYLKLNQDISLCLPSMFSRYPIINSYINSKDKIQTKFKDQSSIKIATPLLLKASTN